MGSSCPARYVCSSVDTDSACGDPSEYPVGVLHPGTLIAEADATQFRLQIPEWGRFKNLTNARSALFIADGLRGMVGDAMRLADVLKVLSMPGRMAPPGQIAVLIGRDRDLKRLLPIRGTLGSRLAEAGFIGAIGPGFSTWSSHSPWESQVSIQLSNAFAVELAPHIPTVPTIVWRSSADIPRLASWIAQAKVPTIAVDAGPARSTTEWLTWCGDIGQFAKALVDHGELLPTLIINGPGTTDRILSLQNLWPGSVIFLTQRPWRLATAGQALLSDLSTEIAARDETCSDLFLENRRLYLNHVRGTCFQERATVAREL